MIVPTSKRRQPDHASSASTRPSARRRPRRRWRTAVVHGAAVGDARVLHAHGPRPPAGSRAGRGRRSRSRTRCPARARGAPAATPSISTSPGGERHELGDVGEQLRHRAHACRRWRCCCTSWPSTDTRTPAHRGRATCARGDDPRPDRQKPSRALEAQRRPVEAGVRHAQVVARPCSRRRTTAPSASPRGRRCGRSRCPAWRRSPVRRRRPARRPRRPWPARVLRGLMYSTGAFGGALYGGCVHRLAQRGQRGAVVEQRAVDGAHRRRAKGRRGVALQRASGRSSGQGAGRPGQRVAQAAQWLRRVR